MGIVSFDVEQVLLEVRRERARPLLVLLDIAVPEDGAEGWRVLGKPVGLLSQNECRGFCSLL